MFPPSGVLTQQTIASAASVFDVAVAALTPDGWWTMQDTDFNSQITDVSGNSEHLLTNTVKKATVTTPLRTNMAQACRLYGSGWPIGTFTNNCSQYKTSGTTIAGKIQGQNNAAIQVTTRMSGTYTHQIAACGLCGLTDGISSPAGELFELLINTSTKTVYAKCKTAVNESATSPGAIDADTAGHIWTALHNDDLNYLRLYRDGVQVATSSAWPFTGGIYKPFFLMAQGSDVSYPTYPPTIDTDHVAVWGGANTPTEAEILDMHTKYLSEI